MAKRIPRDKRKYLLKESDRSGFKYFKQELVRDGKWWVHPTEYDEPPPHPKYIGGEGERNSSGARENRSAYPTLKPGYWQELT